MEADEEVEVEEPKTGVQILSGLDWDESTGNKKEFAQYKSAVTGILTQESITLDNDNNETLENGVKILQEKMYYQPISKDHIGIFDADMLGRYQEWVQ